MCSLPACFNVFLLLGDALLEARDPWPSCVPPVPVVVVAELPTTVTRCAAAWDGAALLVLQQPAGLNVSRSYLFPLKEDLYSSALILCCRPSNAKTLTAGVRNLIC